jgi:hypothetical protein
MGEPTVGLSATGLVGVKSLADPCESFVRFFFRKLSDGIESRERFNDTLVVRPASRGDGHGGEVQLRRAQSRAGALR